MSNPRTVADYAAALLGMLPVGRIWPRDLDTNQWRTASAMVPAWVRNEARARILLGDAFPATALELLPDWEASLGLPDPCAGAQPTVELRRVAVRSRLTARGGQSVPYFQAVAALLGYGVVAGSGASVWIEEFRPFRFGQPFGRPLAGPAWAHAWRVHAAGLAVRPFRFGVNRMGEPFATWGDKDFECALRALAPAHTVLGFVYSGPAPLGAFILGLNSLA